MNGHILNLCEYYGSKMLYEGLIKTHELNNIDVPNNIHIMIKKVLRKSRFDRWACGVCGGLGDYSNINSTLWRLIFIIGAIFYLLPFMIAYFILAIFIPEET